MPELCLTALNPRRVDLALMEAATLNPMSPKPHGIAALGRSAVTLDITFWFRVRACGTCGFQMIGYAYRFSIVVPLVG